MSKFIICFTKPETTPVYYSRRVKGTDVWTPNKNTAKKMTLKECQKLIDAQKNKPAEWITLFDNEGQEYDIEGTPFIDKTYYLLQNLHEEWFVKDVNGEYVISSVQEEAFQFTSLSEAIKLQSKWPLFIIWKITQIGKNKFAEIVPGKSGIKKEDHEENVSKNSFEQAGKLFINYMLVEGFLDEHILELAEKFVEKYQFDIPILQQETSPNILSNIVIDILTSE